MSTTDDQPSTRGRTARRLLAILAITAGLTGGSLALPVTVTQGRRSQRLLRLAAVHRVLQPRRNTQHGLRKRPDQRRPGPFLTVLIVAERIHQWFILQYYNRGLCVGFNPSLVPWESQRLFSYRC